MHQFTHMWVSIGLLSVGSLGLWAGRQDPARQSACKAVHADLVEDQSTTACKPSHPSCFLGVVDGNHGLRGTTYFRADGAGSSPPTSPGFISYSGVFEYATATGTLTMRETGVVNQTRGNPESGAVTAFQKITGGTGAFATATGHLFVSGFSRDGHVVTKVGGEICVQ